MPTRKPACRSQSTLHTLTTMSALAATLMLGACAQGGVTDLSLLSSKSDAPAATETAAADSRSDLEKAVEYWGKAYAKNPRDLDAALSYAKNLKAMGQKEQALNVLQQVSMFHGQDRRLASEYGRLALELDQIQMAERMLEVADDPAKPDWRVVSARGTVLAKQSRYGEAIKFFERARSLAPDQPSVMNNLALAYTMNGDPQKAETLLREASAKADADPKVRQNLALVLGLQGKYDESKRVASQDIPPEAAAQNADLMRKIVKLEPKRSPAPAADATAIAQSGRPAQPLKGTATATAATGAWDSRVAAATDPAPSSPLRPSAD